MKKHMRQKLLQAISCLVCVVVAWTHIDDIGASEFSGGRVTGPIFTMFDNGSFAFIAALIVTFVYPRVAAAIALAASLLCLPLYLYFTVPGPFRWVFRGEYKVSLHSNFVWNKWAVTGMLTLAVTAYVCLRTFLALRREGSQHEDGTQPLAG